MAMSEPSRPTSRADAALRARIGWLCQLVRWGAVAYAAWVLFGIARYWSDPERVARHWSAWLHFEVPPPDLWRQLAGFAVHFVLWAAAAAACYAVWRLFTAYLSGEVFSADAAQWLRRIAVFGLIAQLGDMLARPLVSTIVAVNPPAGAKAISVFANPPDLLNLIFLLGFLALAQVFKAAAEIVDDHAQIV